MTINLLETAGLESALHAMRNPMDSWAKSDSQWEYDDVEDQWEYAIGELDQDLSERLQTSGPEHAKHLRMIMIWADIVAPLYWWKEADTYRAGVEKISCSTMHKLMARPLTEDDFEHDAMNDKFLKETIEAINSSMEVYHAEKDPVRKKEIWRGIIQALPESYLQRRTVMASYAALRNICKQRKGHKLIEWEQFINFCKELSNSWMIFE